MKDKLIKRLNPDQIRAIEHTDGPSLILAGAGSGKTSVLTSKVAYLLMEKGVLHQNILMVTFTNKAANEMKGRIMKLIHEQKEGNIYDLPTMCTFHAFCAKVLRRDGIHIGIPKDFIIFDDLDTKEGIKEAMKRLDIDPKTISPAGVASTIAQAKNELISPSQYLEIARGFFQENVSRIYPLYQKILQDSSALDFEDLIFATVSLFRNQIQVAAYYQNLYKYILIDEYQDTNRAQYILSKNLAQKYQNITVVGDASQSIYAWRGADFRNIANFQKDYPDTKVFHLEQNYRSTQIILDAAFSIISKNLTHPILKLWTKKEKGDKVTVFEASSELEEAAFIIQKLNGFDYKDAAVLYRTNAQSRILEEAFLRSGIPYILVGGVRFYERKEIKDVLSFLRLIINPNDKISYRRIEKLGKRRLNIFLSYSKKLQKKVKKNQLTTLEILDDILQNTDYLDRFNPKNEEDISRLENIRELKSVASEFPDIINFLENVALIEKEYTPDHIIDIYDKKNAVTLMTMHAAKGLEFKTIFMVGMEEGLFPHTMSLMDPTELEEERRLCYVGFTRAKENLYLSFAKRRLIFGQRTNNQISRFICEIPEHLTTSTGDYPL